MTLTCNCHNIILTKRLHFDKIPRAGFGTCPTAGALAVINRGKSVNNMQSIELARTYTIAITKAAELAGLNIGNSIGSST